MPERVAGYTLVGFAALPAPPPGAFLAAMVDSNARVTTQPFARTSVADPPAAFPVYIAPDVDAPAFGAGDFRATVDARKFFHKRLKKPSGVRDQHVDLKQISMYVGPQLNAEASQPSTDLSQSSDDNDSNEPS